MTKTETIDKVRDIISELVYNKTELQKAYNYYNGKRDALQFRYLEENFGIGSPTAVLFTPLLRKHVDALVGEYLGTPILPKVTCKDQDTISNMDREKLLKIAEGMIRYLKSHLNNQLIKLIGGKDTVDTSIKLQLDKVKGDIERSFISLFEVAAQNVILYIMQSRETDMITKLRLIIIDLLVGGYTYFRVIPSPSGDNISIEVCDPLNTFDDRDPQSPYVRDASRSVIRRWLTQEQVLSRYGKDLSKSDRDKIKDHWKDKGNSIYRHTASNIISIEDDLIDEIETLPGYPDIGPGRTMNFIPVYDVEWIETDDKDIMQRYSATRIGDDIYILNGKDKNVVRSMSDPKRCRLSLNGVFFLNRSSLPFSLILKCAHLQD